MEKNMTTEYPVLSLAYLGDAVIEIEVRKYLLSLGAYKPKDLVEMSKRFVTCEEQSDAVERILPVLTEEEESVYRRGRNAKTNSAPKHGHLIQYKRATGFEALFGYLYMKGNNERITELFKSAYML